MICECICVFVGNGGGGGVCMSEYVTAMDMNCYRQVSFICNTKTELYSQNR